MGFVQSRKPLKLIHQFSSSIKDQQKPIGQEKFMLARCQALGGYISLKFRYNKPSLKYQQRTRQSEWKELGKVAARLLMEIQMTPNKSWQLLWMESGPCFLFSFDVFHLVKDNPPFLIWLLQQSSMPQEFRNCRNGGSSHRLFFPWHLAHRQRDLVIKNHKGYLHFKGLYTERWKTRKKYMNDCLWVKWWPANKVPKDWEWQSWPLVQNQWRRGQGMVAGAESVQWPKSTHHQAKTTA